MRIISIGRSKPLLDKLTKALAAKGHDAVSTTKFDDPKIDQPYDVAGFGRAVTPQLRKDLEHVLRARNPEIATYLGMCPEVGVLVGQVEYELAKRDQGENFTLNGTRVTFQVHNEVNLRWKIRHVNMLFRASDRVLAEAVYPAGEHVMDLPRPRFGTNFLQVEAKMTVFTAKL